MTTTVTTTPSDPEVDSNRLDEDGAPTWTARDRSNPDVRLVWAPRDAGSRLAGAWWPRTRDATAELQSILPAVTERIGGAATRVSLNIDAWDADQPRRLWVGHTFVKLGWFRTLDPATVTFGRHGQDRLAVVVIPSDTDATAAGALLHRFSTTRQWPDSAGEALDGAGGGERPPWES